MTRHQSISVAQTKGYEAIPIVILNWNGEADTLECLKSIRESDAAGFLPIVVDNGSSAESLDRLKQGAAQLFSGIIHLKENEVSPYHESQYPRIPDEFTSDALVFIESAENLGFAKGSNLGIRFAKRIGADWVMLLNNDTVASPILFQELRKFREVHPSFAAITAQIRCFEPRTRIQNCGGDLTYFGSRRYRFANADVSAVGKAECSTVSFVTGCALLFNHSVTGPLTEDFFFGEEDYEFSLRMKKLGLPMACAYKAIVYHKGGGTIARNSRPLGGVIVHYANRLIDTRNYYSSARWHAARVLAYLRLPLLLARKGIDPRKAVSVVRRTEVYLRTHRDVRRADHESMINSDSHSVKNGASPAGRNSNLDGQTFHWPGLLFRKLFRRELYNVGFVAAPIHRFLEPGWRPQIHWLPQQSRPGTFIADPFGVEHEGKRYLFCEYFDYREPYGRIVAAEAGSTGALSHFQDALVSDTHVSYPFPFVYDGQLFCVPETSRSGGLLLYKMLPSEGRWVRESLLIRGDVIDPSIINYDGHWWLFYGFRESRGEELFISYANTPRGPWLPHAKQPVKRDLSSSRSGGTPFLHRGKLYRPAQDCSRAYGQRVVINEVVALSPTEFQERAVAYVEPDRKGPYPDGLHTLSAFGDMTLVDGKKEQFIWPATVRSVRSLWKLISGSGTQTPTVGEFH